MQISRNGGKSDGRKVPGVSGPVSLYASNASLQLITRCASGYRTNNLLRPTGHNGRGFFCLRLSPINAGRRFPRSPALRFPSPFFGLGGPLKLKDTNSREIIETPRERQGDLVFLGPAQNISQESQAPGQSFAK
jgi:hypothetical protein